ncbi:hypothetical protein BAUCODRAFT_75080 [Baudoinia panamericana UAMH 10762]|uniref:Scramblase-domain-containing protein n=1 Tax=Baudoinia panamericana (strain UAMH 10762) TaxID=717646 RepID=M2N666_BAUPA|nr:uncharacterized protein BAUCODRAFT_75080 [Baudoinia panamericana UAMH 10762]EMC94280.1 hypothetical protein BAUCODRAFT_75080 [Baudoinia panamericana UAMH 10762]
MRQHNEDQQQDAQEQQPSQPQQQQQQQPGPNTQLATALAQSDTSDLVTSVNIPSDPHAVLPPHHPALSLLSNSSLVIQRQIEMMNLIIGFEQANRYVIMNGTGETLGYIAERDHGLGSAFARQMFKTHRSFTTHIFDAQEKEVLRIHRPFAYINSRIRIYDPIPEGGYDGENAAERSTALQGTSATSAVQPGSTAQVSPLKLEEMRIIGECQQSWHPFKRNYNLFTFRPLTPPPTASSQPRLESGDQPNTTSTALTEASVPDQAIESGMSQFAHISEPLLSWDFNLRSEDAGLIGTVNRNFSGFAREIFTDSGVYVLRMDSAAQSSVLESKEGQEVAKYEREATGMTLDQRAVMLATAVSIDFDYFSRHSHAGGGGGFFPIFWPMGGGTAAEGAGAAGAGAGAIEGAGGAAAGGAGAMEGAGTAVGAAGRAAGGVGASESGIAAAGTMAGYEAMQRGAYGQQQGGQPLPGDPANEAVFDPDGQQRQAQQSQGEGQGQPGEQREGGGNWWDNDNDQDPWGGGGGGSPPPSAGGEGGGGGGSSWTDALSDFFGDGDG